MLRTARPMIKFPGTVSRPADTMVRQMESISAVQILLASRRERERW